MTNRLLFIGLDAGDARLIEQWSGEGWLPNIARMRAEGTLWAPMQTPADVFHVSARPSIFTGAPADVHGLLPTPMWRVRVIRGASAATG